MKKNQSCEDKFWSRLARLFDRSFVFGFLAFLLMHYLKPEVGLSFLVYRRLSAPLFSLLSSSSSCCYSRDSFFFTVSSMLFVTLFLASALAASHPAQYVLVTLNYMGENCTGPVVIYEKHYSSLESNRL